MGMSEAFLQKIVLHKQHFMSVRAEPAILHIIRNLYFYPSNIIIDGSNRFDYFCSLVKKPVIAVSVCCYIMNISIFTHEHIPKNSLYEKLINSFYLK